MGRGQRSALSTAQKKETLKIAKRALNTHSETKHYYSYGTGSSVSTAGSVVDLCAVSRGDADTERDGDELEKYGLLLRARIISADYVNAFRIIIFQWKPNDTTPSVANILVDTVNNPWMSPVNHDNEGSMFRILYDRTYEMSQVGSNYSKSIKIVLNGKKLGKKKISFVAGGTNGSDKLFMLRISDSTASTHPGMSHYADFAFKDL